MEGTSIMKNSVKIVLCVFLLLVLVQGVQAAETYQFVTKWGTQGTGDGQFYYPRGIAVDSSGYVYVMDRLNNRMQKFDSNGNFVTKWDNLNLGMSQNPADNNRPSHDPLAIAVDKSGNIYMSDAYSPTVYKFSPQRTLLTKWGSPGNGDGQFHFVEGIAIDPSGNIIVVNNDDNARNSHNIQKFSSNGTFLKRWGTYGAANGQFMYPLDVAVDAAGNIYVADTFANRTQKFDSNGQFITSWGSTGSGDGQFGYPSAIAIDSQGYVYVGDALNNRIQKFTSDGVFVTKWEIPGIHVYPNAWYYNKIAIDSAGNVYVTDGLYQYIQKFAPVQQSQFIVSSITPVTAANTGNVNITDIIGTGFMYGSGVKLTKTGSQDIIATNVVVAPPTHISCTFDLTGKDTGQWNVVVINPDGTLPTLPNGFTITGNVPPTLQPLSVTAISPSTGTNDQSILSTVTGTGFKPGAVVKLTLAGQPDIVASGVTLTGNSTITCTFDLTGKATGTWDLAVTNPVDGTTSVRSTAFTLTSPHVTETSNGVIIVSSTPQDALVYLDGVLKGTGSVTLKDVSPGYHSVRVTKTMYNDYGTDVRVAAGSTNYVTAVLIPVSGPVSSGTIIASSNPPGANVYLDGMDKGFSPVTITNVSSGSHTVSFTKTGYAAASRTVTMTAGQTMDITVELTKTGGGWGDWLNTTTLIIIGIIVLIIIVIGVLLRKKKNRWDNY